MDKNTFTYIPKGNFTYSYNLTTDITFCKTTLLLLNLSLFIPPFCIKGPLVKINYVNITFSIALHLLNTHFVILWT
jgi:hypothetical protein